MGSFGKDGDELKETELTLGLPGVVESDMMPQRSAKRPFSRAISDHTTWPNHHCIREEQANLAPPEKITGSKEKQVEMAMAPPPKAQVVGWPPIRSFRKNTLTAQSNSKEEALYVKVSMDGAPYLRKVDLKVYDSYRELSSALEKMFSCFTMGQCGSHQHGLNESNLMDLLNGSEYVPTYEDKDGDLMLVGDVPWEMFIDSCKRLRIMKGSEAIGLAPRSMEKCKT